MPIISLMGYVVLVAATYRMSAMGSTLIAALDALAEGRRQLLVSPVEYRKEHCSGAAALLPLPQSTGIWAGFILHCEQQTLWRNSAGWQPLCRNFGEGREVFPPRYYRLHLSCHYRMGSLDLALPEITWELFR